MTRVLTPVRRAFMLTWSRSASRVTTHVDHVAVRTIMTVIPVKMTCFWTGVNASAWAKSTVLTENSWTVQKIHFNKSLLYNMLYNKSDSSFTDIVFVRAGQSECEQCDSSCRTCSGNRKDQCDSCQEGEWFQDCLQSTYVSYASAERLSLSNVESWNLYACLYVYTGMFLTSSQLCVSVCPPETHGNQTSGRCEDCSAGCLTCQDAHHCLKCKNTFGPLYLQDGKCVAECKRWKHFFQNTKCCWNAWSHAHTGCVPECTCHCHFSNVLKIFNNLNSIYVDKGKVFGLSLTIIVFSAGLFIFKIKKEIAVKGETKNPARIQYMKTIT